MKIISDFLEESLVLNDLYFLTPPDIYAMLDAAFYFDDFDPCPWPRPEGFDGLKMPWPQTTYLNPPYTADYGSKTAFIHKAIAENKLGKTVVGIISSHGGAAINLLLGAGAELSPIGRNGRVAWIGVYTRKPMPSPVPTLLFVLRGVRQRRPGRPSIGDQAMTPAERQRRRRARLRSHETQVS